MKNDKTNRCGVLPKVLPMIQVEALSYYVDLRLRQFREMHLLECVEFDSEKGRAICDRANILSCGDCGMSVIVPGISRHEDLRCFRCMSPLR